MGVAAGQGFAGWARRAVAGEAQLRGRAATPLERDLIERPLAPDPRQQCLKAFARLWAELIEREGVGDAERARLG